MSEGAPDRVGGGECRLLFESRARECRRFHAGARWGVLGPARAFWIESEGAPASWFHAEARWSPGERFPLAIFLIYISYTTNPCSPPPICLRPRPLRCRRAGTPPSEPLPPPRDAAAVSSLHCATPPPPPPNKQRPTASGDRQGVQGIFLLFSPFLRLLSFVNVMDQC